MRMKILRSGLKVNDSEYYKLLEWKDVNGFKFKQWCNERNINYSINDMSLENYAALLYFAEIWHKNLRCESWCADCKAFDWSMCKEKYVI